MGVAVDYVSTQDRRIGGRPTGLHLAAQQGHAQVLQLLLRHNAPLEKQDVDG